MKVTPGSAATWVLARERWPQRVAVAQLQGSLLAQHLKCNWFAVVGGYTWLPVLVDGRWLTCAKRCSTG